MKKVTLINLDLESLQSLNELRGYVPLATFLREEVIKPYIKDRTVPSSED